MKSPKIILRYIVGLVSVFGAGFVLLVAVHYSFAKLLASFDLELENERARIAIGEVIIANVNQVERNFYQLLTTSADSRSVEKISQGTEGFFAHIEEAFTVFKNGGSLSVTTRLNEKGVPDFVRTITYVPHDNEGYVLEIIDLRPKVLEVKQRMQTLASLVVRRNSLTRSGDQAALMDVRGEIVIFLKKSSAYFVRLHENANGLYYQGHKNLERLKAEISSRKSYHTKIDIGGSAVIIFGVLVTCWLVARQIYATHSQLGFVSQEMEKAKRQADVANKMKADFLATMSHEVRTPMNIIVGTTGLALETKLTPVQQRYMARIQSAGEVLLGLMNDILDFSKIEGGELEFVDQPFDMKELIHAVAEVVRTQARQKGIAVEVDVVDGPWIPGGDPVRMRQILLILANNAVKFTEKGSVDIQGHLEESDSGQPLAVITVRDTGIGIAKEELFTIFDTFAQGDASSTRRYGGAGLGLAISNQLAKLMGGEITVESEVGQGSIFTLSLPVRKVSLPGARSDSGLEQVLGAGSARTLDILLADSDGGWQGVVQDLLGKAGHRVKHVTNGLEALRCMAKFQYDAVFLSLDMAELDGREVAKDIRAFENGEGVARPELGYDVDWLAARLNGQHTYLVAVGDEPLEKEPDLVRSNLFDGSIGRPYVKDEFMGLVDGLAGSGRGSAG